MGRVLEGSITPSPGTYTVTVSVSLSAAALLARSPQIATSAKFPDKATPGLGGERGHDITSCFLAPSATRRRSGLVAPCAPPSSFAFMCAETRPPIESSCT